MGLKAPRYHLGTFVDYQYVIFRIRSRRVVVMPDPDLEATEFLMQDAGGRLSVLRLGQGPKAGGYERWEEGSASPYCSGVPGR